MDDEHFGDFRSAHSTYLPRKRIVVTGLVAFMLLFAGCGGNSDDGGTTTMSDELTSSETPTTPSEGVATGTQTDTSVLTSVASPTTQSNRMSTSASGLNVTVEPTVANSTDVTAIARATMTNATASEGIENITVDTGGGLDLRNVTVANVSTAGIDNGGLLPSNQTDESLAANVERDIEVADGGQRLIIPLDGNQSIENNDQLVAVIEGGIATNKPGNYSFNLTIDDGPSLTDSYNVTES